MERAVRLFQVREAVVCTQAFHLPRAVFLARRAGIDAVGLRTGGGLFAAGLWDRLRESFATIRAVLGRRFRDGVNRTQAPIDSGPRSC